MCDGLGLRETGATQEAATVPGCRAVDLSCWCAVLRQVGGTPSGPVKVGVFSGWWVRVCLAGLSALSQLRDRAVAW